MFKNKLYYLILFSFLACYAHSNQITGENSLKHAHIGWSLVDCSNGEVLSEFQQEKSFPSASLLKLVTVASSLKVSNNSTLETHAALYNTTNGMYYLDIIPKGDFTFGSEFSTTPPDSIFAKILQLLKLNKVSKVSVKIKTPQFIGNKIPPGYIWEDIGNYYGASSSSFFWRDNTYRVYLKSGNVGRPTKIVKTNPTLYKTSFINNVIASNSNKDSAYIYGSYLSSTRIIEGSIPAKKALYPIKGSIGNSKAQFLFELEQYLHQHNIRMDNTNYSEENIILLSKIKLSSSNVKDVYKICLHKSLNHYAEGILLNISNQNFINRNHSISLIDSIWKANDLKLSGVVIKDGSGLSPMNKITPKFITSLLVHFNNEEKTNSIFPLLPVAGKEGTVKYFLKKSPNEIRLKSGSMSSVRNYAGYITSTSGKKYAICICISGYTGSVTNSIKIAEKHILRLAELCR